MLSAPRPQNYVFNPHRIGIRCFRHWPEALRGSHTNRTILDLARSNNAHLSDIPLQPQSIFGFDFGVSSAGELKPGISGLCHLRLLPRSRLPSAFPFFPWASQSNFLGRQPPPLEMQEVSDFIGAW